MRILSNGKLWSLCNGALRQRGKNETKSNANLNMRTCLLCMRKGVSLVDEMITNK